VEHCFLRDVFSWRDCECDSGTSAGAAGATESGRSPKVRRNHQQGAGEDRKLRYQNAADIRADLQRLKRDSGLAEAGAKPAVKSARWWAIAGVTIVVIGLAVGRWLFFSRKAHALTDKGTIVLADFTNTTGDAVFAGTLRQGLSVQLEQSPFLSIISDQQIQQTLQMMSQEARCEAHAGDCSGTLPADGQRGRQFWTNWNTSCRCAVSFDYSDFALHVVYLIARLVISCFAIRQTASCPDTIGS
jgi:hypothetical protein